MSEDMNLSVNGHSKVPPGFRFHPTEEELLHYYLRKKVASEKIDLDVIRDVDLNKLEPWDIQEKCKIGSTPQNDWYFFSHKDKKYPTGTRTNRATAAGFWKATGRDKVIHSNLRRIGMRKTLVFYRGRAPHGQKSDWIMHEYRLDDNTHDSSTDASNICGESGGEEGWVVCRVFKKKNYHKALESPLASNGLQRNEGGGVLDQILMYMGRSSSCCKQEMKESTSPNILMQFPNNNNNQSPAPGFMHLPELASPTIINNHPSSSTLGQYDFKSVPSDMVTEMSGHCSSDWVALDRLVASQLNGQSSKQFCSYMNEDDFSFSFDDHDEHVQMLNMHHHGVDHHRSNDDQHQVSTSHDQTDLWNFAPSSSSLSSSSSDPLCHLSV